MAQGCFRREDSRDSGRIPLQRIERLCGRASSRKNGGQRRQPQAGNRVHWTKLIMLGPEKDEKQGHTEVGPVNDVLSSYRIARC